MGSDRVPLTRERALREAVALADEGGIAGLPMRRLAQRLGVEAMSLYNHVAIKEDLLNGMADLVSAEFVVPDPGGEWRQALRRDATSARAALVRHSWAGSLLESRSVLGPARRRYLDGLIGALVDAGFTIESAHLAVLTLDSHIHGFALQEVSWTAPPEQRAKAAGALLAELPKAPYPHVASMARLTMGPEHDPSGDFHAGLTLILEAVGRLDGCPVGAVVRQSGHVAAVMRPVAGRG